VSGEALNDMSRELRSWRLNCRSDQSLDEFAQMFNKVVRGWINYYGRFYKSALYPLLRRINTYLVRWASGNTNGCATIRSGQSAGWWVSRDASRPCWLIGGSCGAMAGQWEPGELRGSCPVSARAEG
jgi:hypothetical protein